MTIQETIQRAMACHQSGDQAQAQSLCRAILEQDPNEPNALNYLGVAAYLAGEPAEAVHLLNRAIAVAPHAAHFHFNLSLALAAQRKWDGAADACRKTVELTPDNAAAWNHLGGFLRRGGKTQDSLACQYKAVELDPQSAEYHGNLGLSLGSAGRLDEAAAAYRRSLQLRPNDFRVINNLGRVLYDAGRFAQAGVCFEQALELQPNLPEVHSNLGMAMMGEGDLDGAIDCFNQALTLQPDSADTYGNLGMALLAKAQVERAVEAYDKAAVLRPDTPAIAGSRLFALHFHPDYDAQAILREHRLWDERFARPLLPKVLAYENDRSPGRRLRIGYVSPHFRGHCQSLFTLPLLAHHDHQSVEVFCYADVARPDLFTERIRGHADAWRPIVAMSDAAVAQLIGRDRIDVLVDLTMHMGQGRPLLFARKPAPVQVAWLAYPGTTGLTAMDYRLTDPRLDPAGEGDQRYSEKSIRLADTFWCFDPRSWAGEADPPLTQPPVQTNGHVTFGCLNNTCKLNGGVLKLWSRILLAVPRSRLLLLAPEGECRQRLSQALAGGGVEPDRVDFVGRQARADYLAQFGRIDVCLDTLPYNGHTTSLDSFWTGVPVVSRLGRTVVGRAGLSQSHHLGLAELVADDDEQFVKIAAELAGDAPRLAELRRTLRERLLDSPLTDAETFARNIEAAYRQMWQAWCASQG